MNNKQFYALIATAIFLGLCLFFAFGGVFEYQHLDGNRFLKINKLTGKALLNLPYGADQQLKPLSEIRQSKEFKDIKDKLLTPNQ